MLLYLLPEYKDKEGRGLKHSAEATAILDLVIETLKLAPKLQIQGDQLSADLELTSSRWGFLSYVAESNGQLTVADLSRRMSKKRQTLQRFADATAEQGLIRFIDNPDHKTAKLLEITPLGLDALESLRKRELAWAETVINGLTAKDIKKATAVLSAFRENI